MIIEIVIPNLGATGGNVIVEQWLVEPGQFVQAGAPLFVVTTDKATVEVEAFRSGFLHSTLVETGVSLPPGTPVALLADTSEELTAIPSLPGPLSSGQPVENRLPSDQIALSPQSQASQRTLASPLARRMARQAGLNLTTLKGSGRQGAILKQDVARALTSRSSGLPDQSMSEGEGQRLPVSARRKAIAQRTQLSKTQAPHFYASTDIDMVAARQLLSQAAELAARRSWPSPTVNDLVLRAVALALRQVPRLNASYQETQILIYDQINLGLVIGLPDGMIIPVVHNADQKNLFTIAAQTRKLKEKAQSGVLSAFDLNDGTFTVSNLGMFGLDSFTAVINPPQAGILALGAVRQSAVVWEDQVLSRWRMTANLSVDHRAVDGLHVAAFMQELRALLENPFSLTLEAPDEEPE